MRDRVGRITPAIGLGSLLFLVLMPPAAQASIQYRIIVSDEWYGSRVAPILLLTRKDVQDDLHLSSGQAEATARAAVDLQGKARALEGKRGRELLEGRKAVDEELSRRLATNLTFAQQARLAQIDLQWEGLAALISRPVVVETLALSEAQRKTIRAAVDEFNALRSTRIPSSAEKKAAIDKGLGVLSAAQSERWQAMLGRPFHLIPTQAVNASETARR